MANKVIQPRGRRFMVTQIAAIERLMGLDRTGFEALKGRPVEYFKKRLRLAMRLREAVNRYVATFDAAGRRIFKTIPVNSPFFLQKAHLALLQHFAELGDLHVKGLQPSRLQEQVIEKLDFEIMGQRIRPFYKMPIGSVLFTTLTFDLPHISPRKINIKGTKTQGGIQIEMAGGKFKYYIPITREFVLTCKAVNEQLEALDEHRDSLIGGYVTGYSHHNK